MSGGVDHIPVMLDHVLETIRPADHEVYVDGTFGAGGYSEAMLEAAGCTVIGVDRDKTALERSDVLKERYGDRFVPLHGCFGDVRSLLSSINIEEVDGFVVDLGVSSMQLDQPDRGFSFRFDGPLDMRMDRESGGETAADVVNRYKEGELADIIYHYGEERRSRQVARAICERRAQEPIETTESLAEIVRSVVAKSPKDKIDPATRTFQALRVHVNKELDELKKALFAALHILKEGGRLIVVSFHSLEDGIVKRFMREMAGLGEKGSRYYPEVIDTRASHPLLSLPSRKAIFPTEAEISANPRSRSARMRVAIRTSEPVSSLFDENRIWEGV